MVRAEKMPYDIRQLIAQVLGRGILEIWRIPCNRRYTPEVRLITFSNPYMSVRRERATRQRQCILLYQALYASFVALPRRMTRNKNMRCIQLPESIYGTRQYLLSGGATL